MEFLLLLNVDEAVDGVCISGKPEDGLGVSSG